MKISDLIKMGLRNLNRRKARTALTVIGVIIGTLSIVVMVSIGIGMNQNLQKNILENGGMTIISVRQHAGVSDSEGNWESKEQKLDDSAVEQLKQLEHIVGVSPMLGLNITMKSGKYQGWGNFMAMDFEVMEKFEYPKAMDGTYPGSDDKKTFYIGKQAIQDFYYYSGRTSIMKTMDLEKDKIELYFEGFAVNEKKKPFIFSMENHKMLDTDGQSQHDWTIYIDINYYKELFTKYANTLKLEDRKKALASMNDYREIQINVDSMENVTAVQDKIKELGFLSDSNMQYIQPTLESSKMMQMVLGIIGGISMVVSAINIANTMIMAIYERTKEIGVMKVLGCLVSDIKKLFLFEAGMIGLLGGLVGVGFSYFASFLLNTYVGERLLGAFMGGFGQMEEGAKISVIPIWLPFAAGLFGILVGVVSGYIPARKATKISAIEAMKTEG